GPPLPRPLSSRGGEGRKLRRPVYEMASRIFCRSILSSLTGLNRFAGLVCPTDKSGGLFSVALPGLAWLCLAWLLFLSPPALGQARYRQLYQEPSWFTFRISEVS